VLSTKNKIKLEYVMTIQGKGQVVRITKYLDELSHDPFLLGMGIHAFSSNVENETAKRLRNEGYEVDTE
jgi:hypothetical protein